MKFPIKDFFSKCYQIRNFLWIWSHLLKKSLMENFIFCSVKLAPVQVQSSRKLQSKSKTIWLNFLTPLNQIFALLLPQNSHNCLFIVKSKLELVSYELCYTLLRSQLWYSVLWHSHFGIHEAFYLSGINNIHHFLFK